MEESSPGKCLKFTEGPEIVVSGISIRLAVGFPRVNRWMVAG